MKENAEKQDHPYKSIQNSILISMVLLPGIPFIISLLIGYYYFITSIESNTIASMKRIVGDHRHMIESFLEERKSDLDFILFATTFEEVSKEDRLGLVFQNLASRSQSFIDLGVFNEEGIHVAYQGPYELKWKNYKEEPWFRQVMDNGYYISDIFLGYRNIPHFIIAVSKTENSRKWVLRATIDTQLFNNMVEPVRIGKTGEAFLLNSEGVLQTRQRSGKSLMEKPLDNIQYPLRDEDTHTYIAKDSMGEKFLYATTWLRDKGWLLVVRQEKADAFSALSSAAYNIILISVIGLFLIAGLAFYTAGRIVQRLQRVDTEKEALGHQLIRAQRLAELGEMAAGFAHEINNPLQIIRSEQALIEMNFDELKQRGELKTSEELKELEDSLDQIKLQIDRCAGITQAILKFGRQQDPQLKDVDLTEFIPQIAAMVSKKASVNGIEIRQKIAPDTPLVHCDPGQLQQVLLNLFNNAMDAIVSKNGSKGGTLGINSYRKDKRTTEIVIEDNGCGIGQENLKKIFSPFFTTKPVGKGTGLGLSVCYGIINNMGGTIHVKSQEGVGTSFFITLPEAKKSIPSK
jgi:two-component system NtrC family sensor kinase